MCTNGINRTPLDQLYSIIPYLQKKKRIAEFIDEEKALVMANYFECLMNTSSKMPEGRYKMFTLKKDLGVQKLQIGTMGGGYNGPYRVFKITANKVADFAALGINRYSKNRTILCVALQKKHKNPHHSLQLAIDDYLTFDNEICIFRHKGHIGLGSLGSGLRSVLRNEYVAKLYPKIIDENGFLLGKVHRDRLWYLDDKEIINFTENLISYALTRDRYRDDAYKAAAGD